MTSELETMPSLAQPMNTPLRWPWRHCYALLIAGFWVIWQVSALPIPQLEETRIMGGLHPVPVLFLLGMLKLMWMPPWAALALYIASFRIRALNTPVAVAVSVLCCTALLAIILVLALFSLAW